MNDSQSQAPVDARFTPTQNPQSPGGQALSAPSSDLQKTADLLANPSAPRITSVGDSDFQPFTAGESAVVLAPVPVPPARQTNYLPVFLGGGLIISVCLIVTWAMTRKAAAGMAKHTK